MNQPTFDPCPLHPLAVGEIELRDDEPGFSVVRGPDGHVRLTVNAGSAVVAVNIGGSQDSASLLADSLRHLTEDAAEIVADWEEPPDENDGTRLASAHQDIKAFAARDTAGVAAVLSALAHVAGQACRLVERYQAVNPTYRR